MRVADPNKVIDDFQQQVRQSANDVAQLFEFVQAKNEGLQLQKHFAEASAFKIAGLWELFQGDWFVAAIANDPTQYKETIKECVNEKVEQFQKIMEKAFPSYSVNIQAPSLSGINSRDRGLIRGHFDSDGKNITLQTRKEWSKFADKYLSKPYKTKALQFTNDIGSWSYLSYLIALRNAIAHRSSKGKTDFNEMAMYLGDVPSADEDGNKINESWKPEGLYSEVNKPLARGGTNKVYSFGCYLRAVQSIPGPTKKNIRRIDLIHDRLIDVVERLRVS